MLASMLVIVRQIWMVEKLLRIASIEKVQESTTAKIALAVVSRLKWEAL
ncbi:hypothetical protein PC115_g19688 [Phytophthora cactorum]|nr:hypothetical protein PC115_g19688 [Phytophthora cactorum]